jgi:hypothetical protein
MKISMMMIGAVMADYPGYTIPTEPDVIIWKEPEQDRIFQENEGHKEYVKFQLPDDEYVPLSDLPIVYLNGIKFHRQGKQPRANDLDRFKKITRSSNGQLSCKGGKKAQQEHEMHQQIHARMMANDAVSFIGESHNLDLIKTIFQTKYPRYNGRDAPLNYNELLEIPDLTNLNPSNWYEKELVRCEQDEDGECVQELKEQLEDEQHFPSQTYVDPVVVEEADDLPGKEWTDEELEENRLANIRKMFRSQSNVKIGCCNGLPYNSSKRCCCRRIPFDKDKKFCCAIDGCENFQVFDRSNAQHYKDCLSLKGLVIQEYGYRGLPGQGDAYAGISRKTTKSRGY